MIGWSRLFGVLSVVGLIGLVLAGVFHLGASNERAAWVQRQAIQADQARQRFDAQLASANAAASAAQAETRAARDFSTNLQEELRHVTVPLVARSACSAAGRPVALSGGRAGAGVPPRQLAPVLASVAPGAAPQPASAQPGASPGDAPAGADDGGGAEFTLAAVRLWNSALAGAELPAGACRADDPASEACAAQSGIGIPDVMANHLENAARCSVDRLNHQRLIDYLNTTTERGSHP